MEMCVSGYREAITTSQTRAALLRRNAFEKQQFQHQSSVLLSDDNGRPIRAKVGRVLGRLRRGRISPDQQALHLGGGKERSESSGGEVDSGRTGRERETVWKLSECWFYSASTRSEEGANASTDSRSRLTFLFLRYLSRNPRQDPHRLL